MNPLGAIHKCNIINVGLHINQMNGLEMTKRMNQQMLDPGRLLSHSLFSLDVFPFDYPAFLFSFFSFFSLSFRPASSGCLLWQAYGVCPISSYSKHPRRYPSTKIFKFSSSIIIDSETSGRASCTTYINK